MFLAPYVLIVACSNITITPEFNKYWLVSNIRLTLIRRIGHITLTMRGE